MTPSAVRISLAVALALALAAGCGGKEKSATQAPAASLEAPQPLQATSAVLSPEALEELLAPIALYPDPLLAQIFTASTNPQEVMDAGNWLVANPTLEGRALDEAAQKAGFTPPILVLIQFPEVVDMMCREIAWTEQLGQAFVNGQAGVMDAVQRLRAQAQSAGSLKSSEHLKVETTSEGGEQAIAITPPNPKVVYVPQYDPVAAYAPASAPPPATQTQTTVQQDGDDDDTGAMIATGLMAFTAGVLIGEALDNDDYWYGYPSGMWYRPMPYYPPYPYRPAYGGGFYPSHTYVHNTNVVINRNNDYWDRYDRNQINHNRDRPNSPITKANPRRNDLAGVSDRAARAPERKAPAQTADWKGKKSYAGAKSNPRVSGDKSAKGGSRAAPKVQGTYAGATSNPRVDRDRATTKTASAGDRSSASTRSSEGAARTPAASRGTDRGYASAETRASTPSVDRSPSRAADLSSSVGSRGASGTLSASRSGSSERAASERGRLSSSSSTGSGQSGRAGGRGRR